MKKEIEKKIQFTIDLENSILFLVGMIPGEVIWDDNIKESISLLGRTPIENFDGIKKILGK